MVIGRRIPYLTNEFLINSNQKYMCSVIRFCVLGEDATIILKQQELRIEAAILLKAGNIDNSTTSQVNPWNLYGEYTKGQHQLKSSSTSRRCLKKRTFNRLNSRIIFMPTYNDFIWSKNQNDSVRRDSGKRVAEFLENFKPKRWSCLGLGDEEKWFRVLIDKPM